MDNLVAKRLAWLPLPPAGEGWREGFRHFGICSWKMTSCDVLAKASHLFPLRGYNAIGCRHSSEKTWPGGLRSNTCHCRCGCHDQVIPFGGQDHRFLTLNHSMQRSGRHSWYTHKPTRTRPSEYDSSASSSGTRAPKTPSTAALALSVALLVLGVVAIGLMVGSAGNGFFQHYADVLTRLSHGL